MSPSLRERYEILGELSRGGMGRVMRARDRGLGREVAIKVTTGRASPARFRREAIALAAVESPAVVQVHDFGLEHGQPYLIMELIRGRSLQELIAEHLRFHNEPLAWRPCVAILAEVARGLAACHARGLIHRDVKPENIVIEEDRQRPVLIDFGLARRSLRAPGFSQDLTRSGEVLGTPAFMSPEQLDPRSFGEPSAASDIWSLGATLYYALTGAVPYAEEGSGAAFFAARLSRPPRPIHERSAGLPRWLSELCQRCLSLQASERPTALEMAALLDAPPRRRLAPIVGAGLAGLALITAFGFGLSSTGEKPVSAPRRSIRISSPKSKSPTKPEAGFEEQMARLQSLQDSGRFADAEREARRLLEARPRAARVHLVLGKALHGLMRTDEAVKAYSAALVLDDSLVVAYTNRGEVFTRRGEFGAALADLDRAIRLDPDSSVAYNNRGSVYLSRGQAELAEADYNRALVIDPNNLAALRNRALLKMSCQRWDEALRDYHRLAELEPEDWSVLVTRSGIYEQLGEAGLAARDRAAAIALSPRAASMLDLNYAASLMLVGRSIEALQTYDAIAARDPEFPEIYGARGELRMQLGLLAEALADFRRFLELAPGHQNALRARALIAQILLSAISAPN